LKEYVQALEARGHQMVETTNLTVLTAIERAADTNIYANSDYRKGTESYSAGY
jgi:gamma-glutamyltranspeptidase